MGAYLRTNTAEHSVQGQLLGHFGLRENAFGVTPDPRFLFPSQTHREALASLVNGIDCDFGFQLLVAQPGMGKTTLLFNFLERFRTTALTAFLFQPQPNPCELLQSVLLELGTPCEETSLRKLSEQLNHVLTRAARERKRVIVVLDESQNLDFAVLEALRQLSNFETASAKLMQIVLAGQPQLAKRLALPEQEQLMQRISAFGRLSPMALSETQAYIDHRLATAGYQGGSLFTQAAVRNVWDHSRGVPRNINTLCFSSMLLGFAEHQRSIDESIVEEAAQGLNLNSVLAEVFQKPSAEVSGGNHRVQPIRETNLPETDTAKAASVALPVAVSAISSRDTGAIASTGRSENINPSSFGENVPPLLVAARALIGPVVEKQTSVEQKNPQQKPTERPIAPGKASLSATASSAASALVSAPQRTPPLEMKTAAIEAPANSKKTTAAIQSNKAANAGKNLPPKKREEQVRPERETAVTTATPNKKQIDEKRSESRIWWAKALSLTAAIGILAFVLGQQFLSQRPGQVEADGAGASTSAQNSSGASNSTPNENSVEKPSTQTKSTRRNASNADSGEADDVTVRKFPTGSEAASESSDKAQKLETIFFEQDSVVIGSQYGPFLRRIADALAENPGASAILEGHTDDIGPEGYNLELSSRRAIEVRNALVDELHVSPTRLTAIGAGAVAPVQPNSSPSGRAYNRRVEVRLVHLGE
jgi:type II secretory pathway predicted ATPase ExeA/outer membrane protein OmpA-like peptidoglycan-associated protein